MIGERDLNIIGNGDGVGGSTDRLSVGDGVGSIAAATHCIIVVVGGGQVGQVGQVGH